MALASPTLTDHELGWVTGFFEAKGSFCLTGQRKQFALEAMSANHDQLQRLKELVGGEVYKPPPASPSRWTWRLYGMAGYELYKAMRPMLSRPLIVRGDQKVRESG